MSAFVVLELVWGAVDGHTCGELRDDWQESKLVWLAVRTQCSTKECASKCGSHVGGEGVAVEHDRSHRPRTGIVEHHAVVAHLERQAVVGILSV